MQESPVTAKPNVWYSMEPYIVAYRIPWVWSVGACIACYLWCILYVSLSGALWGAVAAGSTDGVTADNVGVLSRQRQRTRPLGHQLSSLQSNFTSSHCLYIVYSLLWTIILNF